MKRVFFYGLYMDNEILKGLGCNPLDPEVVRLDGYGLRIGEKATLVKAGNEFCLGQLITLEEEELKSLYVPEKLVDYYPVDVTVKTVDGLQISTSTYILPESKITGSNSDYAHKLHKSALRLGFPAEYLKIIESYY